MIEPVPDTPITQTLRRPNQARIPLVKAIGGAAGPAAVAPSAHQA
jgi:hypothetical protein